MPEALSYLAHFELFYKIGDFFWSHWSYIVALDVEVGEVDGDPPLRRSDDLPDAVLVGRVQVRKRRRHDRTVGGVGEAAASV